MSTLRSRRDLFPSPCKQGTAGRGLRTLASTQARATPPQPSPPCRGGSQFKEAA
jgi:hypothetical protein